MIIRKKIRNILYSRLSMWRAETRQIPQSCKTIGSEKVIRVNYGYSTNKEDGTRSYSWALMRESIYRGIMDGTLAAFPADNEYGFVVFDKVMHLAIPRVKTESGRAVY